MSEQLDKAAGILARQAQASKVVAPNQLDVSVLAEDLPLAVEPLIQTHWGYLSAITGLDQGSAGKLEVLYQFCSGPDILTLRVLLDRTAPKIPTICSIIPAANVLEWELSEMFGITIIDNQNPKHLYLPDNWPEGVYPMRKDAVIEGTS